jgi:methionine synthase II (cobalamin-independent)
MSSKLHQKPPFRAEHLGSLLRPKELLKARVALEKKEIDQKALTAAEDSAIKDIVKTQIDIGFHPISDGEYRRHMFWYVALPSLDFFIY